MDSSGRGIAVPDGGRGDGVASFSSPVRSRRSGLILGMPRRKSRFPVRSSAQVCAPVRSCVPARLCAPQLRRGFPAWLRGLGPESRQALSSRRARNGLGRYEPGRERAWARALAKVRAWWSAPALFPKPTAARKDRRQETTKDASSGIHASIQPSTASRFRPLAKGISMASWHYRRGRRTERSLSTSAAHVQRS